MGFAGALHRLMDERGLSGKALARQVPCDAAYISRLASGKQRPSVKIAQRLDSILGAGGELAGLARSEPRLPVPGVAVPGLAPDPDLAERVGAATGAFGRADGAVIGWLEQCLDAHRRLEDAVGGAPLRGVVAEQLGIVAGLAHSTRGPDGVRLVALAAQYAQFIAWMCVDCGDHSGASAWYDRAYGWAAEAGDANMAATSLSMRAHVAWSAGNPHACIRLGEAACWHETHISPGVQGMAAQMAARGHAMAGRADRSHARLARVRLDEAETLIRRASEHPSDEPPWMYFYGETWFTLQRGMAELHLANWVDAVALLGTGLAQLADSYRRDRAWYAACLARALAESGDAEQAADVAVAHARDAAEVNSYACRDLKLISATLTGKGAREGAVIRDALASASASASGRDARASRR
jgi:transcriptional regulator with XRE-family HTH domain